MALVCGVQRKPGTSFWESSPVASQIVTSVVYQENSLKTPHQKFLLGAGHRGILSGAEGEQVFNTDHIVWKQFRPSETPELLGNVFCGCRELRSGQVSMPAALRAALLPLLCSFARVFPQTFETNYPFVFWFIVLWLKSPIYFGFWSFFSVSKNIGSTIYSLCLTFWNFTGICLNGDLCKNICWTLSGQWLALEYWASEFSVLILL